MTIQFDAARDFYNAEELREKRFDNKPIKISSKGAFLGRNVVLISENHEMPVTASKIQRFGFDYEVEIEYRKEWGGKESESQLKGSASVSDKKGNKAEVRFEKKTDSDGNSSVSTSGKAGSSKKSDSSSSK